MTLPQNVADAVKAVRKHFDLSMDDATCEAWCTVRAHLMSQEEEIERLRDVVGETAQMGEDSERCLAAANAQLRLMHRVLSQAVCVACADDGSAKDHELDKLEGVLRDQGWITSAVVPTTPTDKHPQGAGDEA